MKLVTAITKIVAAMAAVVGAIYLLATYGEQIVAWCKKVMASLPQCPCTDCDDAPVAVEEPAEAPTEEPAAAEEETIEEVVVEEVPVAEVPAEEVPVAEPAAEDAVVADEADFVQE